MMKIPQYSVFVKNVLDCKNLFELREVVGKINEFNKNNSIRASSEDFKKLETIVGLMKIKLRNKQGVYESKNFMISETQFQTIVENNKIDNLVSEYMNSQDLRVSDIGDGEFNVSDGEFGKDILRFRIQYSSTVPDHHFDVLYISDRLISQIITLFGFKNDIALSASDSAAKVIMEWFNKKYDKKLTMNDWEWMDYDESYDVDDEMINEQYDSERLYPKDYIIKVLKSGPKELKHLIKKLPSITCSNDKGEETICTKIPEVVQVYLTGRY